MTASNDTSHVFDDLRRGLGLRKHSHSESRKRLRNDKPAASLFFQKGWRDVAPPKVLSAWTLGPVRVLEALVGAPSNSLIASQLAQDSSDRSLPAHAQLQLLRTAVVAEGGLLPTARALAIERGRRELQPADITDAVARATIGFAAEGRLASAAAVMARLLIESRAEDDSPQRQGLVLRVSDLINELKSAPWPASLAMGGQRIARLVEALWCLPAESIDREQGFSYTEIAACSSSEEALGTAEERLRLLVRVLLHEGGGLLKAAREVAAERTGGGGSGGSGGDGGEREAATMLASDDVEPADLVAASARALLLLESADAEAATPEGVAATAEVLAGWLRDARPPSSGGACSTRLSFCPTCRFAMPCPWGC